MDSSAKYIYVWYDTIKVACFVRTDGSDVKYTQDSIQSGLFNNGTIYEFTKSDDDNYIYISFENTSADSPTLEVYRWNIANGPADIITQGAVSTISIESEQSIASTAMCTSGKYIAVVVENDTDDPLHSQPTYQMRVYKFDSDTNGWNMHHQENIGGTERYTVTTKKYRQWRTFVPNQKHR